MMKKGFTALKNGTWEEFQETFRKKMMPALQQFPVGRLRLVGLWGKIHKVVARNLWRKVRLDATEQALGRTNRGQF